MSLNRSPVPHAHLRPKLTRAAPSNISGSIGLESTLQLLSADVPPCAVLLSKIVQDLIVTDLKYAA